jgi:hypothetical protein
MNMNQRSNRIVSYEATHSEPVWRTRSNFIIAADISERSERPEREQLWARQIGEFRFEICCIPFFVYDLALGDEVETDRNYLITRVVKTSGRYVFRVWFGGVADSSCRDEVVKSAHQLGCELEWSSRNLLAIAAPSDDSARKVADYLEVQQELSGITYETGRTR